MMQATLGAAAALRYTINAPLAMAYVPMQIWRNLYSAEAALGKSLSFYRI